jgi:hypothetical protein
MTETKAVRHDSNKAFAMKETFFRYDESTIPDLVIARSEATWQSSCGAHPNTGLPRFARNDGNKAFAMKLDCRASLAMTETKAASHDSNKVLAMTATRRSQ